MDLEWRDLTVSDAAEMAELTVAERAANGLSLARTEAQMAENFDVSAVEGPRYCYGAFESGRMAAFGILATRGGVNQAHSMPLSGVVRPDLHRRGIGSEIVRRAIDAAPAMHARTSFPDAPLELIMFMLDDVPGQPELAGALGFEVSRRSYRMSRDLPSDPAELHAPVDAGLELVAFDLEYVDALRETHATAFVRNHPGAIPVTPETWSQRFTNAIFRAEFSFFIRDKESKTIAGYLLANCFTFDAAPSGKREVTLRTIATRREFRRRGVASALTGAALTAAVKQGFNSAGLFVDAQNPTGAVRVYERAGFQVSLRSTSYTRKIST